MKKTVRAFVVVLLLLAELGFKTAGAQTNQQMQDFPAAYPMPWDFSQQEKQNKPPETGLKNVAGLLVPHHMIVRHNVFAAYKIFASMAASEKPEVIFIVSPNHYQIGPSNIQINSTGFNTRFGFLETDKGIEKNLDEPVYDFAFYHEHGISTQVSFIKYFFPDAKIVPIILKWDIPRGDLDRLIDNILKTQKKILLVASIDFSHYQKKSVADFHDVLAQNAIERCDPNLTDKLEIDSRASLYLFLNILQRLNRCSPWIFKHTNSQDFSGDSLPSTTSHFISIFGSAKDAARSRKPPGKISGLFTVIHNLRASTAGQEDRFFMGNDEIFLKQTSGVYKVNLRTKKSAERIYDKKIINKIEEGDKHCKSGDFGVVKGSGRVYCF